MVKGATVKSTVTFKTFFYTLNNAVKNYLHVKGFLFFILAGLKTDFMPWIPGITKCNWEKCTFLISEDIGGLTFTSFIAHN